jgi:hypothetical protein
MGKTDSISEPLLNEEEVQEDNQNNISDNVGSINSHGVLEKHAEPMRDPSYRTLRSEGEIKRGTIGKVRAYASRHA